MGEKVVRLASSFMGKTVFSFKWCRRQAVFTEKVVYLLCQLMQDIVFSF